MLSQRPTGLSVGKDAHVVAVNARLYEVPSILQNANAQVVPLIDISLAAIIIQAMDGYT